MLETKTCINVYSETNPWIDFCIVIGAYEDFTKAEEIVQDAYDEWFENESDEPIAEYISQRLIENEIYPEVYFKNDDEE